MFGAGETVTLITRTASGEDAYGNTTYTESQTAYAGCAVWPTATSRTTSEDSQARDMVTTGLTVVFPLGATVKAIDRAQIRGGVYEVDGDPQQFHSPFTGLDPGLQVAFRRVTG